MLHVCAASFLLFFSTVTFSGTKVAFTGDQGTDDHARAVLAMIANEGTDLLLIQGDLGYDPFVAVRWEANLTQALGADFPVLSVVGNHENHEWDNYHDYIKQRVNRASGLDCSGNVGVKAHCQFKNIEIIQVSPGINEIDSVKPDDNYAQYISDKFSGDSDKWRICTWHKNMRALQTGQKGNSTGWDVYRSCLNVGAMVAVAHEHAYSRTHLMSNFENQSVVHQNSEMTLEPGKSFMFVSGLGGRSVRPQVEAGGDWWASIYTASQGATHGALFCDFEQSTAECYFKAINGAVPDRFTLNLKSGGSNSNSSNNNNNDNNNSEVVSSSAPQISNLPVVFKRNDADEIRWIDYDANGRIGSVWIDKSCADALGGVDLTGNWDELVQLAPSSDSLANPCSGNNAEASINPLASIPAGYVFQRTDKDELRWIDKNASGQLGSVRIDSACAAEFGGVKFSGDWTQLLSVAPALDAIPNPCLAGSNQASVGGDASSEVGYVYARTDKDEMRWVGRTASGEFGSVRINKTCANNLGGAYASGDWFQLLERAPGSGDVVYPCNDNDAAIAAGSAPPAPSQSTEYIFERTDKREFRWVAQTSNGDMGNVWIDESCVAKLGLRIVKGDWDRLNEVAPVFDSLQDPCVN